MFYPYYSMLTSLKSTNCSTSGKRCSSSNARLQLHPSMALLKVIKLTAGVTAKRSEGEIRMDFRQRNVENMDYIDMDFIEFRHRTNGLRWIEHDLNINNSNHWGLNHENCSFFFFPRIWRSNIADLTIKSVDPTRFDYEIIWSLRFSDQNCESKIISDNLR